jgi:hypothetical protein
MKQVFGYAHYSREQWEILKKMADDDMDDTYEDWQEGLRKGMAVWQEADIDMRRVDINAFELIQGCRKNKKRLDASARSQFCAMKLKGDGYGQ